MLKRYNFAALRLNPGRNLALIASLGLMWIVSFYFYGMSASRMGHTGVESWDGLYSFPWPSWWETCGACGAMNGPGRRQWLADA